VLLAVATLAAVSVAGARIANALETGSPTEKPLQRIWGATATEEARIRNSLRTPRGFQRNGCRSGVDELGCFYGHRVLLDVATMRGFVRGLGAHLASGRTEPSIRCSHARPADIFHSSVCEAWAQMGRNYIVILAHTSFAPARLDEPAHRLARVRSARLRRHTAEISVWVLGHCLIRNCEAPPV
jgi:hypothetical protein